jgi:hypothetical protein
MAEKYSLGKELSRNELFNSLPLNKRSTDISVPEEQCATVAAVLQSRKTLRKTRKPSPIPARALTLPNNPKREHRHAPSIFSM